MLICIRKKQKKSQHTQPFTDFLQRSLKVWVRVKGILEQNKHSPIEKVATQTPVNTCQAFLQKISHYAGLQRKSIHLNADKILQEGRL